MSNLGAFSMWDLFRGEVESQMRVLTSELLALENSTSPKEHLASAMRAAHSIKGAGRIVSLDVAVKLAHTMEDCLVGAQEGIVTLTDSFLSGGQYNLIDWQDGNDLKIKGSLLQNWAQFAVRVTRRRGGFGLLSIKSTHIEEGATTNPFGAVGLASIISTGDPTEDDFQTGFGTFSTWTTAGNQALRWIYYVMPVSSTSDTLCSTQPNDQRCISGTNYGNGPLLPAGQALVDSSSGGSVTGTFPAVRGATSYNIYRISQTASVGAPVTAPYGTGNFLIASAVNPLTACTDTVCTFTDSVGLTPTSTTVPRYASGSYGPFLDYWPGGLVFGVGNDTTMISTSGAVSYHGVPPEAGAGVVTEELPGVHDISFTKPMALVNGNNLSWQGYAFDSTEFSATNNIFPGVARWFPLESVTQGGAGDGGALVDLKGKLNFGDVGAAPTAPFDILTLWDSNFQKTQNTVGYRPSADAGDCATSMDQTGGGLAFRCLTSISFYLNSLADNSSWLARLTSTSYLFKVPAGASPVAFASLPACASGTEGLSRAVSDSTTNTWGATITGSGADHVQAYCDGTNWTVAAK